MKTIGGYLFILGAGSILLNFMNYEFSILSWIDSWGAAVGWTIRIGMALTGAAMWLVGRQRTAAAG